MAVSQTLQVANTDAGIRVLGRSLKFPLEVGSSGSPEIVESVATLEQAITRALEKFPGEQIYHRGDGIGLLLYIHEPDNETERRNLAAEARRQIMKNVRRVRDVICEVTQPVKGTWQLRIGFSPMSYSLPGSMVLPIETARRTT